MGIQAMPAAQASFPGTASGIHRWEPEFMAGDHSYTRDEAVRHARMFDVIVAVRGAFSNYVAAMKAANPNLTLLVYLNGGYSMNENGTKYPSSLYERDRNGNKIKSIAYGSYLMDVSSSGWRSQVRDQCLSLLTSSGYDGCGLDSLGPAALSTTYVTGLPVNPSTGSVWTRSAWLSATHGLAAVVKNALGTRPLAINGVRDGMDYFDPGGSTGVLADGIDGGIVELFIRSPLNAIDQHRTFTEWKQDVDMLANAGSHSRALLCVAKVWVTGTSLQIRRWHNFALGSFLLGTNGRSYFSFLGSRNTGAPDDIWVNDIGSPSGAYFQSGGVFKRTFGNGLVLVNPTASGVTVRLAKPMRTSSGTFVSSVSLAPYDGAVLASS